MMGMAADRADELPITNMIMHWYKAACRDQKGEGRWSGGGGGAEDCPLTNMNQREGQGRQRTADWAVEPPTTNIIIHWYRAACNG